MAFVVVLSHSRQIFLRFFLDARMLERYGAAALQDAILEALVRDAPHPNAVHRALEHKREQQGGAPPVALALPDHVRDRDAPVRPHALETYDRLKESNDDGA